MRKMCLKEDKHCYPRCPLYLHEFGSCYEGLTDEQRNLLERQFQEERAKLLKVYAGCSFVKEAQK